MTFPFVTIETIIARNAGALYNFVAGNATMTSLVAQAGPDPTALINTVYTNSVGNTPTSQVADVLIANLGITGEDAQAIARDYVMSQLDPLPIGARGAAVNEILVLFSNLTGPRFVEMVAAWNDKVAQAFAYAATPGTENAQFVDNDFDGRTFTLTLDIDALTGTSGDDTFNAPLQLQNPADATSFAQTLTAFDEIDGAAGFDRLNADLINDSANGVTVQNVEQFYLRSRDNAAQLSMANVTGVEQLWNDRSTHDLSLSNVQDSAAIGLQQVGAGTAFNVVYANGAAGGAQAVIAQGAGSADSAMTFNVSDAGAAGISRLSIDAASGINNISLSGSLADIAELVVTGTAVLKLSEAGNFAQIQSVAAGSFANDLSLDLRGQTSADDLRSVVTSSGDDEIIMAFQQFAAGAELTLDLGDGSDSLTVVGVNDDGKINGLKFADDNLSITGVEALILQDALILSGDAMLDLDGFALSEIVFTNALSGDTHTLILDNSGSELSTVFQGQVGVNGEAFALAFNGASVVTLVAGADFFDTTVLGDSLASLTLNVSANGASVDGVTILGKGDADQDALRTLSLLDVSESGDVSFTISLKDATRVDTIVLTGGEASEFTIDVGTAAFADAVTIEIGGFGVDADGNTAGGLNYIGDIGNGVREIFRFVGENIGDVVIDGGSFLAGVGAIADRLDFSQIAGIGTLDDLSVVFVGGETLISAVDGQFDGTITVVGVDLSTDAVNFIL